MIGGGVGNNHMNMFIASKATRVAVTHAKKCMRLGGKWITWDTMGEVWEFFVYRKEYEEKFSESWGLFEEQRLELKGANSDSADKGAKETPPAKKPRTSAPGGGGGGGGGGCGGGNPPDNDKDNTLKNFATICKKANELKTKYHAEISAADTLMSNIETADAWNWAKHSDLKVMLKNLVDSTKLKVDVFGSNFLCTDLKILKAKFSREHLSVNLQRFNNVEESLKKLASHRQKMIGMHDLCQV